MNQIIDTLDKLPNQVTGKPTVIIGNTVKGKGVKFMEKNIGWHAGSLSKEDMEKAICDVEAAWAERSAA
jgi:transketolase